MTLRCLGYSINKDMCRETGLDMDHECLRTDGLAPRYRSSLSSILPDYGCLILSPANIWSKDPATFQLDTAIVDTVFSFQRSREGDNKQIHLTGHASLWCHQ